jgi:hypothetical protein
VYQRDQYRNSRHSGAIGLSMVCSSTVLAQGQFRRQIGTESCHRLVGLQGISVTTVIGFVAAADTGSSFFYTCSVAVFLPYSAVFCQP